jgi:hypothetical protein
MKLLQLVVLIFAARSLLALPELELAILGM